jgi:hypothetical protein
LGNRKEMASMAMVFGQGKACGAVWYLSAWHTRAALAQQSKWRAQVQVAVAVHQGEAEGEADMWGPTQFKNYTQTQSCCNFDSIQTLPSES